jgi:hypothetical protein
VKQKPLAAAEPDEPDARTQLRMLVMMAASAVLRARGVLDVAERQRKVMAVAEVVLGEQRDWGGKKSPPVREIARGYGVAASSLMGWAGDARAVMAAWVEDGIIESDGATQRRSDEG